MNKEPRTEVQKLHALAHYTWMAIEAAELFNKPVPANIVRDHREACVALFAAEQKAKQ